MTPKFDELFETLMEDLANQGQGMLANRGGGSSTAPNGGTASTPTKPTSSLGTAPKPAANLSGQKLGTQPNAGQQDFNNFFQDKDDNKVATNVLNHLTTNGINVNDPKFAETPEGQAIGQRIQQSPNFANALNMAQQNLAKQATQNTQKAFAQQ